MPFLMGKTIIVFASGQKQLIDERIALSGLPRVEFFIQSCIHQKVITFGNVKTFDGIKKKLVVIDEHLQAVEKSEELDLEILESLRMILEMFAGLESFLYTLNRSRD